MPKISKARIVNFSYNDGKRLIADELFLFDNLKGDEGHNVLINLKNGGGKSVLVQLLMQPILPKAKVANRRIESFFTRPGDHCFILLEWLKDRSPEKLLTGIAMASREASTEDDEVRGLRVKYYTFYTQYAEDDSPFSIARLSLSRKEKGGFRVVDFDWVRNLAKRSGHAIEYYPEDDRIKWKQKLAEYGVVQEEWQMIERLNSEEGGLGKYFEAFKTSDTLVDRLLIPTIEGKLQPDPVKGDASLSTTLLDHAKRYSRQKDVILEKERLAEFEEGLAGVAPQAEELWNSQDRVTRTTRQLFGLSDALEQKIEALHQEQEGYGEERHTLDREERHIRHERLSALFYRSEEDFECADRRFREAERGAQACAERHEGCEREMKILSCARYYRKGLQARSSMGAIEQEILRRESGGDASDEINKLKRWAASAVRGERERLEPSLSEDISSRERTLEKRAQLERTLSGAQKERDRLRSLYDRKAGELEANRRECDSRVGRLSLDLTRRLDGYYAEEEIRTLIQREEKRAEESRESGLEVGQRLDEAERERQDLPEEIARLSSLIGEKESARKGIQKELEEYGRREEKIGEIFAHFNLDFSKRFTDLLPVFLREEERKNAAGLAEIQRAIALNDEEIRAAERGELHLPHSVTEYLKSTDLPYRSCERYLLDAIGEGKIDRKEVLDLLARSPSVAYGVLMEEETIRELRARDDRPEWLPALVPIFSLGDMEHFLEGKLNPPDAIAFYAKEAFSDREHYRSHLLEVGKAQEERLKLAEHERAYLKEALRDSEAFAYPEGWKPDLDRKIRLLEDEREKAFLQREKLKERMEALAGEISALAERRKEIGEDLHAAEGRLQGLAEIRERMEVEDRIGEELGQQNKALDQAKITLRERKRELEAVIGDLAGLEERIGLEKRICEELEQAAAELGGSGEEPSPAGESWRELLDRYRRLRDSIDREREKLDREREEERKRWLECEEEIARRELAPEDYQGVEPSPRREEELRQRCKELKAGRERAETEKNRLSNARSEALGRLKAAREELVPFGEALPRSEVGNDFEKRIEVLQEKKRDINARQDALQRQREEMEGVKGRLSSTLEGEPRPGEVKLLPLEREYPVQCKTLIRRRSEGQLKVRRVRDEIKKALREMENLSLQSDSGIRESIRQMTGLVENRPEGDAYYTLGEHIRMNRENAKRAMAKIETDLKEFESGKRDLIRQCRFQGERIYEGLRQMENSSRVTVHAGKPTQKMIRFNLPERIDPLTAEAAIAEEVDKGVRELVELSARGSATEAETRRMAEKIVGSSNLLRKYIGEESVRVDAYKIDQNAQNSGYRSWGKTQVNNSGAEKFVVYFAVILSLINYTRGAFSGVESRELHSALILDNPFGATSSRHILQPMFAIAKHFRVQMICLSDIDKGDVVTCFDTVIKAWVKRISLSNREILTHEGNESVEHGYYRLEEPTLF